MTESTKPMGSKEGDDSEPGAVAASKTKSSTASGLAKRVRKVNEQAHANYRRLKIKSKQSKGGSRGRFGRMRR